MMTSFLRLNAVKKSVYDRPVLKQIDYAFAPKSITWIKGAEGQGKSLLTNLICNLETPDEGSVDWDECKGRDMGVVFDTSALISNSSIAQNLALAIDHYRVPLNGKNKNEYISELLNIWGLPKTENLRPVALSRGQCVRIALIRALIASPTAFIWDDAFECFAGEDLRFVHRKLQEAHTQGMALILLSRYPSIPWDFAVNELQLEDGRLKS